MKRIPALLEPRRPRPRDDELIQSDLGRSTAPRDQAHERRVPNWEKRRLEGESRAADALAYLEQIAASTGGLLARWQAPPEGDVLLQGTYLIPAGASYLTWSWKQSFAAVQVANLSPHELCVTSFAPAEAKPQQGAGVAYVPSGFYRIVPMRGSVLTVYGTATGKFDLAVFIRPRTPSAGQCGTG